MHQCLRIFIFTVIFVTAFVGISVAPLQAHPHHSHDHSHGLTHTTHVHGFWSGAVHPFSGVDHLLAMLAVGVLSVQVGGRALWAGPLSFLGGVSLGGVIGSFLHYFPGVEAVIAVSLIMMGMALALKKVPSHVYLYAAFALFGVFHGFAHVQSIPAAGEAMNYMTGFVAGSAVLHAAGLVFGFVFKNSQHVLLANVTRVSGASIAAAGLFLMLQS